MDRVDGFIDHQRHGDQGDAPRYYIAENRTYTGYDDTLRTGPYNFGWTNTRPDWVERFPYQNGLLVSYVDYAYYDNNTITHPVAGSRCRSTLVRRPSSSPAGASSSATVVSRSTRRSARRPPTR